MHSLYIADDNHDFADFIATVARQEGWKVEVCSNGYELINRLKESHGPALLFVDVNMPVMDGLEAIEGLVGLDRQLTIRFITGGEISTIIAAKMIANARDLKVGRSIFKPISKAELVTILRAESKELTLSGVETKG
ncbi:response regulator [Falsihalocynthiibacter arcticus]|uniref:Response regulatory domain-containing protein n=1 Tax=Falsihalocynthiibacter arcticus TaxID=1579316 RepID=A0A126UX37_9RHOB|nr:response regulator [Falsihalocynthiibacter arcticus]AML50447.1 hypothetical protein RC74_03445 [Falsihalocynthiibacter arcticus]